MLYSTGSISLARVSLFFAGAALLVAGFSFGQNMGHKLRRAPTNRSFLNATLDLETGVITRGPKIQRKASGGFSTVASLDNLDFAGFIGIDSGPNGTLGPVSWVSNADKSPNVKNSNTGGKSKFVGSFVFAYCSATLDPSAGGPGAAMTIEFFEGYTPGTTNSAGPTGTSVATISLSGLPGCTGTCGFGGMGFANCQVVLLRIALGTTPVVLADSNFGYSYTFNDLDSGGILAGTAIFLGCVQSCSGSGPDGIGQIDNIDRFVPQAPGTYLDSFAFDTAGPFPPNRTSVAIRLEEQTPIDTSPTVFNGSGVNTLALTNVSPPILGGALSDSIDCSDFPPGKFATFRVGFVPGTPLLLSGMKGELLVSVLPGTGLDFIIPDHLGAAAAYGPVPVPLDLGFYGFPFEVQGFCGGQSISGTSTNLSSAFARCVGSE